MELYAHHTYLVRFEVYICAAFSSFAFSSFAFAKAKLEEFMPYLIPYESETRKVYAALDTVRRQNYHTAIIRT
jgi:hypothetical protein